tara:strand:+ start:341 stop:1231 length:891 start_codon:yes stop_codon:yes gene_type:complete
MNIEDYYIIVNPISGNGKSKNLMNNLTVDLENKNITYKIIKTEYSGHAKKICNNLQDYDKIIIIGGDGTFNEAINGIMLNNHKPTIGFIPGGTGNAMMHDLNGTTYDKALDIILSNRTKKIDVMQLDFNDSIEYSINIVGWGMAADINILSEKLRFLGPTRYTIASMYYVFNKVCRKAKIKIDEREIFDNFLFILTLNTIHTGRGMKAAPKAKLDDGLIDIIILKSNISKLELLLLLPKIFSGKHVLSDKVEYVQGKKINIIPDENEILNIDGEMRCSTPINISILPRRLEIFSKN